MEVTTKSGGQTYNFQVHECVYGFRDENYSSLSAFVLIKDRL